MDTIICIFYEKLFKFLKILFYVYKISNKNYKLVILTTLVVNFEVFDSAISPLGRI